MRKQESRSSRRNQLLAPAAGRVWMLTYITNLIFPDELGQGFGGAELRAFLNRVRMKTEHFWPEIWADEPDQIPPEEVLRRMRAYLQEFWLARDERDRNWHIHRARELCQSHQIMRETRQLSKRWQEARTIAELNDIALDIDIKTRELRDEVPPRSAIEDALFELQRRAQIPSKRPMYCPDCTQAKPYFLSDRKGQKYCSPECAQAAMLASKRKSWSQNNRKWRSK